MRVNINVSDRINNWFNEKANELGVTRSALMCMAMNEYIDQKEAMVSFSNIQDIISQVEKIKEAGVNNG